MDAESQNLLIKVNKKFEKLNSEIAMLKLKKYCPFYSMFGNKITCPYKSDEWNLCYDMDVCPGNGDAWCAIMIERGIIDTKLHYDDNHDDDEWTDKDIEVFELMQ